MQKRTSKKGIIYIYGKKEKYVVEIGNFQNIIADNTARVVSAIRSILFVIDEFVIREFVQLFCMLPGCRSRLLFWCTGRL